MTSKEKKSRFTIRKTYNVEPMALSDYQTAERILAKLVAHAYAVDHPEIFGPVEGEEGDRADGLDETDEKNGDPNEDIPE